MTETAPGPRPSRRVLRRVIAWVGLALAAAALAYSFGSMQPPSTSMRAAYDRTVASGRAEPVEARFHIPIPGCVCHSPDPVVQAQHSTRYIRECAGCHGG